MNGRMTKTKRKLLLLSGLAGTVLLCLSLNPPLLQGQTLQESGSVGIEGTVPAKPPANAPTITVPKSGQGFSSLPIAVSGICQTDLLVEVFNNNVFVGSAICTKGSYSIDIDLFYGQNDLIARQYDELNQASPDSNLVSVTFTDSSGQTGNRISLFTAYAKRGATSPLNWPLTISGGKAPYAISVDWGDKSQTDLISRAIPGDFEIIHTYKQSGVYKIVVRATDANGLSAFLQLVGIRIGPIQQEGGDEGGGALLIIEKIPLVFWLVTGVCLPLFLLAFWLGRRHQLQTMRARIRKGQRPL